MDTQTTLQVSNFAHLHRAEFIQCRVSRTGQARFEEDFAAYCLANEKSVAAIEHPYHDMILASFGIHASQLEIFSRKSVKNMVSSEIDELTSDAMFQLPSDIIKSFKTNQARTFALNTLIVQLQLFSMTVDYDAIDEVSQDEAADWCRYHASLALWLPTFDKDTRTKLRNFRAVLFERLNKHPNW